MFNVKERLKPHMPERKVGLGAAVGGAMVGVVWVLNSFFLPVPMPAEVGMSIATFITFLIQYYVRD